MITLYQYEVSPFCDKVRRIMNYKGIGYQTVEVSLVGAGKHSVSKKLPVIDDSGNKVEDSTQIALYLEQQHPDKPLYPNDARELAHCHIYEDWADESIYFYDIALHFSFAENAKRRAGHLLQHEKPWLQKLLGPFVPSLLRKQGESQGAGRRPREVILADIERFAADLETLLDGQDYLLPSGLSMADISVFVQFYAICVAEAGQAIVDRYPRVSAWMSRVDAATG